MVETASPVEQVGLVPSNEPMPRGALMPSARTQMSTSEMGNTNTPYSATSSTAVVSSDCNAAQS
jgi:hypothetical protein